MSISKLNLVKLINEINERDSTVSHHRLKDALRTNHTNLCNLLNEMGIALDRPSTWKMINEDEVIMVIKESLMKRGYTYDELYELTNLDKASVDGIIKKIESEIKNEKLELYHNVLRNGADVFYILKKWEKYWEIIDDRHFSISWSPYKDCPYLWVKLDDEFYKNHKKIKIVPISDFHFGVIFHNSEKFDKLLLWLSQNPDVLIIVLGDMIEFCTRFTPFESLYKQISPEEQVEQIIEKLIPVRNQIIMIMPGNHEDRGTKQVGIDPARMVAQALDVPYSYEPTFIDIFWNEHKWSFHVEHGSSHAITEGGKINAAIRPLAFTEYTEFFISAHVHDKSVKEKIILCRDEKNFRIIEKKQYICILGAFLKYFGSYGSKKGYAPTSTGLVVCKLYANGDYHARS